MSNTVPTHVKPSGPPVLPSAGMLPGIPSQPSAEQEAVRRSVDAQFPLVAQLVNDSEPTADRKLQALLAAHGIPLEIRPRGEGRNDTVIDLVRDGAGGYVFLVGPDRDPAEALEFAHTVIRRHNILPESLDPEFLADRKLSRLVPAKVGQPGRVQVVHVPCPEWCVVDHLTRVTCLEDVVHFSDVDGVTVVTLTDDDTAHSAMTATIGSDPTASDPRLRAAHVLTNSGQAEDACLTPDMADELADELIAFAAQLRGKARTARLFNRAEAQA